MVEQITTVSPTLSRPFEVVEAGLRDLGIRYAFVGGAVAPLYVPNPRPNEIRFTKDVDCVFEVAGHVAYHDLQQNLRKRGFRDEFVEKGPICRLNFKGIKVDILPADGDTLGFTNAWYEAGLENLQERRLQNGKVIHIFSVAYFLASKVEAFKDRGQKDYRHSQDLEDICFVLDGCEIAIDEIETATVEVRQYLASEFSKLSKDKKFKEDVVAFFPGGTDSQNRIAKLHAAIEKLSALAQGR